MPLSRGFQGCVCQSCKKGMLLPCLSVSQMCFAHWLGKSGTLISRSLPPAFVREKDEPQRMFLPLRTNIHLQEINKYLTEPLFRALGSVLRPSVSLRVATSVLTITTASSSLTAAGSFDPLHVNPSLLCKQLIFVFVCGRIWPVAAGQHTLHGRMRRASQA